MCVGCLMSTPEDHDNIMLIYNNIIIVTELVIFESEGVRPCLMWSVDASQTVTDQYELSGYINTLDWGSVC